MRGEGQLLGFEDSFAAFAGGFDGNFEGGAGNPWVRGRDGAEIVAGRKRDGGIWARGGREPAGGGRVGLSAGELQRGMVKGRCQRQRIEIPICDGGELVGQARADEGLDIGICERPAIECCCGGGEG